MSRVTEVKTREDPIAKKGQKRALLVLPSFCSPFAIALLSDPFAIGWIFFAILLQSILGFRLWLYQERRHESKIKGLKDYCEEEAYCKRRQESSHRRDRPTL